MAENSTWWTKEHTYWTDEFKSSKILRFLHSLKLSPNDIVALANGLLIVVVVILALQVIINLIFLRGSSKQREVAIISVTVLAVIAILVITPGLLIVDGLYLTKYTSLQKNTKEIS